MTSGSSRQNIGATTDRIAEHVPVPTRKQKMALNIFWTLTKKPGLMVWKDLLRACAIKGYTTNQQSTGMLWTVVAMLITWFGHILVTLLTGSWEFDHVRTHKSQLYKRKTGALVWQFGFSQPGTKEVYPHGIPKRSQTSKQLSYWLVQLFIKMKTFQDEQTHQMED